MVGIYNVMSLVCVSDSHTQVFIYLVRRIILEDKNKCKELLIIEKTMSLVRICV